MGVYRLCDWTNNFQAAGLKFLKTKSKVISDTPSSSARLRPTLIQFGTFHSFMQFCECVWFSLHYFPVRKTFESD